MGSMLAQFYKKVDPRTTRRLLQGVNEDCDPSPCTGKSLTVRLYRRPLVKVFD